MEKYFFGIDGGGTRSRLALTDSEGNVLARAESGSTNIYSVSRSEARDNLFSLLEQALKIAGIGKDELAAGVLGSAGLGREKEQVIYREMFDSFLGESIPVKLCGDGEILLCGGLNGLEGYCLIAGTGSIALGRSQDGRMVRAGGQGYMLGDEGSASWMGKTAVARTLRSLEERDLPTEMLDLLLEKAGLLKAEDFISYVHHDADKAKIASLAPVVSRAASLGDALALDILRTGSRELALLAGSVLNQSPWIKRKEMVLAGGVLENDELFAGMLKEILAGEYPDLILRAPKGTALDGACLMARSTH